MSIYRLLHTLILCHATQNSNLHTIISRQQIFAGMQYASQHIGLVSLWHSRMLQWTVWNGINPKTNWTFESWQSDICHIKVSAWHQLENNKINFSITMRICKWRLPRFYKVVIAQQGNNLEHFSPSIILNKRWSYLRYDFSPSYNFKFSYSKLKHGKSTD